MKKLLFILLFIFTFSSAVHAAATATLQNVDAKSYKDFLLQHYVAQKGCTVQIPNEYTITFDKVMDNKGTILLIRMLGGSKISNQVIFQTSYTIIPIGNNITVQLSINAIMDSGSAFNKFVSMGTDQEIKELNAINNEFIGIINNGK